MNSLSLTKNLETIGLNEKEAATFLVLVEKGPLTPLEISRCTGLNRTTIYRILEKLKVIGVTEEIVDEHRILARAQKPEHLNLIVAREEAKISEIKNALPSIINDLAQLQTTTNQPTQVLYFRGENGLQQILWNLLNIPNGGEFVGFGYLNWNEVVGKKFAEKIRQEIVEKNIHNREITNTVGPNNFSENTNYLNKLWQEKLIPKSVLDVHHDTYIYNDVYAFCHFFNNDLFGIEIHNAEIAKTQRQLFEIVWKIAKPAKSNHV